MIKKLIAISIIVLLYSNNSRAQAPQIVSVTPPSPNVQAMQKYGDIPVSSYTGIPDISIPLYSAKFRDINIPISLSYHSSGIKVSEEASQVGLGWVLNAAGTISRNIIGADDFNGSVYFNGASDTIMDFAAGQGPTHIIQTGCNLQMFNKSIPTLPTIYNYDITAAILSNPAIDFQPDQYYYNYPGQSGKFLMTRKMKAVLQKQEPILISCLSSSGSAWRITSQNGYIYDFTLSETYLDPVLGGTHTSAWYLTKITSPLGNTATFNYSQTSNYVQSVGSYTESRDDWDQPIYPGLPTISNGSSKGATAGKQYTSQVLSSIDLSNCHIKFFYSNNRPDLLGDERLDSLSIFEKDRFGNTSAVPFKTVTLGYGYFNYGDIDDDFGAGVAYDYERLKLTQVQEIGYFGGRTIKNNPYLFTYFENTGDYNMPSKASFARDHWGYYNGKLPNTSLIPSVQPVSTIDPVAAALGLPGTERNTDSNFVKAFTLQAIQYPTGGSTEFQFEANDFDEQNSEVLDGSFFASQSDVVNTSQIFLYDAVAKTLSGTDTLDLTQEYMFTSGGLPSYGVISINAAFRFSSASQCNTPPSPLNVIYFDLTDSTGTQVLLHSDLAGFSQCTGTQTQACYTCGSGVFTVNQTMTLLPGKYIFKPVCLNSGYGTLLQNIKVTYTFYARVTSTPTYFAPGGPYFNEGGGLRIKRIINHDNINPANDQVKRYMYHYFADKAGTGTPQEYSYGRRMSKPEYSYFTIDLDDDATQGTSCHDEIYYSIHLMRTSDSNNPLNGSAGGAVVGYDQVTELFGENGEGGQKVYKYINLPDAVDDYQEPFTGLNLPQRPPYSANLQNALNGSLIEEIDYANVAGNFIKIKDKSNQYTTEQESENNVYGLENRRMQSNSLGDKCNFVLTESCDGTSLTIPYISLNSEWMHIVSSDEKTYNQNDTTNYYEALTNYYFDNPNHLQPTRTVVNNSKGELITTNTHYPLDFPNVTATDAFTKGVANLQNSHVVNAPVEKYINKSNGDGTNSRTENAVLSFFNPTTPTPNLIYQTELSSPLTTFSATTTGSSGVSMNSAYKSLISFDTYDAYGNILQQHKTGGFLHSYLWDYISSLPIAEVSNARQTDIAQTSFEADGSGNWTIGSTLRDSITAAITGIRSYNLSNGTVSKTGLSTGTIYIVSYWSRNGTYSVTGSTGTVTGKTINGWTYYEHTVTGTASVTVSGTGSIDELRLYPKTAQMISHTFDPLLGMTSNCDVDNRITYYNYDALGRLSFIKDQDGNIIKTMQYQLVGQGVAY